MSKEALIKIRISHLDETDTSEVCDIFREQDEVIAMYVDMIRPASLRIITPHSFHSTKDSLIFEKDRRL